METSSTVDAAPAVIGFATFFISCYKLMPVMTKPSRFADESGAIGLVLASMGLACATGYASYEFLNYVTKRSKKN